MIRALPLVLLVVLVVALARWVLSWSRAAAARRPARRGSSRMGGYEFESRIEALKRRRGSSPDPFERSEGIDEGMEEFLKAHSGVEAYVGQRPWSARDRSCWWMERASGADSR